MAKVKRYNGEEDGSFVEAGSGESEKPEGGRFDEGTYARARRFLERGGEEETPVAAPVRRKKPAAMPVAPVRRATAEDIPGQSVKAPEGESASGSEIGRNLRNIAAAATPGIARGMAGVGRGMGALGSSAKAGFQAGRAQAAKERAEKTAQVAGELRRGQRGTKFESAAKPKPRATKKFNEDEMSTEFKKGGAARGWGKARGARKAKIY